MLPAKIIKPIEIFLNQGSEKSVAAVFKKFGDKHDGSDVRMVLSFVLKKTSAETNM